MQVVPAVRDGRIAMAPLTLLALSDDPDLQRHCAQSDTARNLAMEWASLPVLIACQGAHRRVAAGETYYAGDKLNRALVPPDHVRVVLNEVKSATT